MFLVVVIIHFKEGLQYIILTLRNFKVIETKNLAFLNTVKPNVLVILLTIYIYVV